MKTLRTPEERFANLPGYPFDPHYATIPDGEGGTLRVHYLDEGPANAAPILLMHGEPSWSYLYRKMIPILVGAGHRVIAPDLVGFGRSDKPSEMTDYTYARHVAWMQAVLIDHLDLTDATFFGQDWGGLIGLRVVTANPDRFARIIIGNTGLPTGERNPGKAFLAWQRFSQTSPTFEIGSLVNAGSATELTAGEVAAYDAPFPDDTYKAGARILPSLLPTSPEDPETPANIAAWAVLDVWTKPFVCCFSDSDPVTAGGERAFLGRVPGTEGQPHLTVANARHFLQEDAADQLAQLVIEVINNEVTSNGVDQ